VPAFPTLLIIANSAAAADGKDFNLNTTIHFNSYSLPSSRIAFVETAGAPMSW
jgi:hypothetical protein